MGESESDFEARMKRMENRIAELERRVAELEARSAQTGQGLAVLPLGGY